MLYRWKRIFHQELLGSKGVNHVSPMRLFELNSPRCINEGKFPYPGFLIEFVLRTKGINLIGEVKIARLQIYESKGRRSEEQR